jgi:Ca2+:H+ antiporter
LNATFGNAAELIITIAAIRAGLLDVVKASITGSIIGNILLVLGLSFLAGGLKHGFQRFSRRSASVSVTMMTLAVIGLIIPAVFAQAIEERDHFGVEYLSIGVAIALMLVYVLSLIFSFRMTPEEDKTHEMPGETTTTEHVAWGLRRALVVLGVSVVFIAALSEILVGAIEPLVRANGLTELFVGIIVVPIIGNAAEHLVSVEMAMKNKMEISLGIALGSSLQIALFVAPLLVFISLLAGNPMTLVFNSFELAALGAAVLIAAFIAFDGESNWLEGAQLLIVYIILALAFYYLPA